MEIEAKFTVPNRRVYRELLRLRSLAGYVLVPAGTSRVTDRYFDTADRRLLAAGYSCRLREVNGQFLATLKGLGSADGAVHRRDELEVRLDALVLDPAAWPESQARTTALELAAGAELQPLFELNQSRAEASVGVDQRAVALLSLDAVRVVAGRRPALYYELEIELAQTGSETDLAALTGELVGKWGLSPQPRSKFARALEVLQGRGISLEERLSAEERAMLQVHAGGDDPRLARRAAVVLAWADGLPTREIVPRSGLSDGRVRFWLRAFRARRMDIFQPTVARRRSELRLDQRKTRAQVSRARSTRAGQAKSEPASLISPDRQGLPSVARFCRMHGVNMGHARFVVSQALALFEAMKPVHRLPRKRRRLLKQAALLHTIGTAQNPERHDQVGRDLILAQPLRGVSTSDRLALACMVAFNRNKVRPKREPTMAAIEPKMQAQVVTLTALLRVAEALDFSGTQSTQIQSVDRTEADRTEFVLAGPAAEVDAARAADRGDVWYRTFDHELVFTVAETGPRAAAKMASSEGVLASASGAAAGSAEEGMEVQPIQPNEPMSEAGRRVLFLHFSRMLANETGTRQGEDIEALHDMRVATRRMRAAFRVFAPYFDAKTLAPFGKGLRRTGRMLGTVRDLDVLLDKVHAYQAALPTDQQASLEPLLAHWQTRREVARREMLEYLDSRAYRKFTADFGEFLRTPGAGARAVSADKPVAYQVRHVVPRLILERYETVRAYEAILPDVPLTTYHMLRIDCKRLRYTLEFFQDVLGPEAPNLIKQVVAMQDLLGALQDAHVAEGLLAEFLSQWTGKRKSRPAVSLVGVEGYLVHQQDLQSELLADFKEPWEKLVSYDFRRALGLAITMP